MRLGFVVPDATGHLNPSLALARELDRRGHQVVFFASPRSAGKIETAGLSFVPIGGKDDEAAAVAAIEQLGRLKGNAALLYTGQMICRGSELLLRELPDALRHHGIDGLIVDQVCPAAAVVAERFSLPYVVVCNALAVLHDRDSPPPTTLWRYRRGLSGRLRNRLVHSVVPPIFDLVSGARRCGVSPLMLGLGWHRSLAVVAQQPALFDFPQASLPDHFHYSGPWHEPARDDDVLFPWERLDGRQLVYASLGTVQNRLRRPYEAIIEAAHQLDCQFVVALGQSSDALHVEAGPNTIIVPFAPQLRLLERATAAITHAGLNTALECLSRGVPMVCLPITNDQPGVARRVEWVGAGRVLPIGRVNVRRLRSLLATVLDDTRYANAARRLREALANQDGRQLAAAVIEQAFSTGRRVLRS